MADSSTIRTPSQYRFSMSVAILMAQRVLPTPPRWGRRMKHAEYWCGISP